MRRSRGGLIAVGAASALVNVLYLTSSFFMLQVYDRIIPSRSIPSLIALILLALLLYAFQGGFDLVRGRILVRISGVFDEVMSRRIFKATLKAPLKGKVAGDGLSLLRDFDQVRSFLSSPGPSAFFDLPWVPLYVGICFLFHPIIGIIAICGALILMVLTYLTNRSSQASAKKAYELATERNALAGAAQRNAEVVQAMGMADELSDNWSARNDAYREVQSSNADTVNGYSIVSKVFRMALQSGVLAAGAVLVIENLASGGIIIAASILTSRALAPVEQVIASWKGFVSAQQSWKRLRQTLALLPETVSPLELPAPTRELAIEALSSGAPGKQELIVQGVSFTLRAGNALGVIGPSASGKSSLVRAIVGLWPAYRGSVRLDGAALDQWDDISIGRHIGYLPQDVELFAGTVAQNISRFRSDAQAAEIIAAARKAGVHELILRLPKGYETEIGSGGSMLSAGQRQRIALARALYRDPFLVVLDEPNSNLDIDGESALAGAILSVRQRGGIVIVVAHRPSTLSSVDLVLAMREGQALAFGPKDQVLAKVLRADNLTEQPRHGSLKVVGDSKEQGR
ncbi:MULTISPECIES: type I secretion system permease/ATPase [unclassified Rhizobium]|uniref:type I secretion system permease/ATPase n=1 Tax=unclassified Rhizobium TaxID=2613769 RepID=UPI001042E6D1|nr:MULTISPECIES: type I secretion system permease/ATPase [unclassified Rhizobium]